MSDMSLQDAIAAQGFVVPSQIIWDGEIHRFPSDERKRGKKDGWYVAYDDHHGRAAAFGSWRQGNDKHCWSNGMGRKLSAEDWAAIEAKKRAAEAKIKETRQKAAGRAAAIYSQAATSGTSAYLERKGIGLPAGVRFVKGLAAQPLGFGKEFSITGLVVPVTNSAGAIMSVQFIPDAPGSRKLFLPGGQAGGGFHVLGNLADAPVIGIAEGLATAQSAVESTGWPLVVAFSAGNLPIVAAAIRARHPQAEIVLLGDNDPAGLTHATEAATSVKGRAVFPPDGINDFNDLHVAHGLAAVKAALQPADAADPLWRTELIVKPKEDGSADILLRLHNLILIMENAPEWRGKLALDEFSNSLLYDGKEWVDAQALELKAWLEKHWIPSEVKTGLVHESVEVIGRRHAIHPVRSYLLDQRWDGVERIPTFFSDFCGAAQTRYSQAVARCLFVSAVARILAPGCKADLMIVLEGEQGCGKSRLVLALFSKEWHSEITESPGSADFYQALRGRWCCEFGEMAAFGKADKNRIKQVLTQIQDTYRPSYGRNSRTFPRQNIFIGTTNNYTWNDDPTGARRFLPIRCGDAIDIDAVTAIRDQLWAEAVWRFRQGEQFHDIPDAAAEQDARFDQDAWEERIDYWLQTKPKVTILEVMEDCLGLKSDRQGRSEQIRIGHILRRLKWLPKQEATGDRRRFYMPPRIRKSTT